MIGSTQRDEFPIPKDIEVGSARQRAATIEGVMAVQEEHRQQMALLHEKLQRIIGMHQTLEQAFRQFQQQRVVELNGLVNGGPTQKLDRGTDD